MPFTLKQFKVPLIDTENFLSFSLITINFPSFQTPACPTCIYNDFFYLLEYVYLTVNVFYNMFLDNIKMRNLWNNCMKETHMEQRIFCSFTYENILEVKINIWGNFLYHSL